MVDSRNLQWITRLAEMRGAKVLLTGDPKQLDSVSGAREIYEETMRDGLREYVEISGAE